MDPVFEAPASFAFGRFRIFPQRREVLADGRRVEIGGRAFDALVVLIEANGAVVSKDELMSRVWPGRIVEDNSLHAQIKVLCKAFSDHDLIRTVVVAATSSGAKFARIVQAIANGRSRGRLRKFSLRRALQRTSLHRYRI